MISRGLPLVLILVLWPDPALAWGPGVHLALGNELLTGALALSAPIYKIMRGYPTAFLYGALSADIFIGKGSRFNPGHSHNWAVGFRLLDEASEPFLRAFALGYLSHLGADVVAHNCFVPNMLCFTPAGGKFSHTYVEAQADMKVPRVADQAQSLFRLGLGEADKILLEAVGKRRLPFEVRKRLFRGGLSILATKSWKNGLWLLKGHLSTAGDESFLAEMLDLSLRCVVDVLEAGRGSDVVRQDPIGSRNLKAIKLLRRKQRFSPSGGKIMYPLFPVPAELENLALPRRTT
ncbi:MAG: hypothetical protein EOM25_10810 [Deltaproteobacteria bacterium]|nr:hypothetical protein [Deltaproteobacteria bacterium]